jgi:DNA-binding NarL/FixJ family response regulator
LLTKREEDVVRLLAEGMGNRDIAHELMLSESTVRNYMFHIFDKLGVSNRVELLLYSTAVRLEVEENQLVSVFGKISVLVDALKGA